MNKVPGHSHLLLISLIALICSGPTLAGDSQKNVVPIAGRVGLTEVVGSCPKILKILSDVSRVAPHNVPVLITGETGTGKELIAHLLHEKSNRRTGPFRAENVATLSETMAESQLFGHEKGSFTGATKQHKGLFEQCDGGTLFLDEIGELSLTLQVKLLRVLSGYGFARVGGTDTIYPDVRVVLATHRNLIQEILAKRFREDLFYRINVIEIGLPPLRDRKEDIQALSEHFLQKWQVERHVSEPKTLHPDTLQLLLGYHWPGNIRQLENTLRRAMVFSEGTHILPENISLPEATPPPPSLEHPLVVKAIQWVDDRNPAQFELATCAIQENFVRWALEKHGGSIYFAASDLRITQARLKTYLRQFNISPDDFKR